MLERALFLFCFFGALHGNSNLARRAWPIFAKSITYTNSFWQNGPALLENILETKKYLLRKKIKVVPKRERERERIKADEAWTSNGSSSSTAHRESIRGCVRLPGSNFPPFKMIKTGKKKCR